MLADQQNITISKELAEYIVPLSKEEFRQLEKNIQEHGCREPLTVWAHSKGSLILVDGHNRFNICKAHNIRFRIKKVAFKTLDDVKMWMMDNQMGRRNLTPDQLSYYRGLKYLSLKKTKGGYGNVKMKGKGDQSTSETLSGLFNVSSSTVKRDAKFATGLNILAKSNASLKSRILTGEVKVKKSDIQILGDSRQPDKLVIRNEADLHNKAKSIRNELLDNIENEIKKSKATREEKAQHILKELEPAFLSKEDRIRKIKGMMISAINKAVNKKDTNAIVELKKLVDKLEDILF
jgi:hypothetical protein